MQVDINQDFCQLKNEIGFMRFSTMTNSPKSTKPFIAQLGQFHHSYDVFYVSQIFKMHPRLKGKFHFEIECLDLKGSIQRREKTILVSNSITQMVVLLEHNTTFSFCWFMFANIHSLLVISVITNRYILYFI